MSEIEAVISDFGGVLTSPLVDSFAALQDESGIPLAALGEAMMALNEKNGANPLFELETGRMTEADFLSGLDRELWPSSAGRSTCTTSASGTSVTWSRTSG